MQSIVVLIEGGNKQVAIDRIRQFTLGGTDFRAQEIVELVHCAARLDYDDVITEILHAWPTSISATDRYFRTPLHTAVLNESEKVIRLLLKRNDQIKWWADFNGYTPVQMAVIRQKVEVIELFFQYTDETRVVIVNQEYNLLRLAVTHNAERSLCELRRIFSLPRAFQSNLSPLLFALRERFSLTTPALLEVLCEHYPSDIDTPDKFNLTPLHVVARTHHTQSRKFIKVLHACGSMTHFDIDDRTVEVASARFPAAYRLMRHLYFSRSITEWILFSLETTPTPHRRN